MSKIDWSKTPDAQFFVNGSFYKYDQGKWFWSSSDGIWAKTPYESPENFSWWGFRVEAPAAWNGEGLPPVGADCEYFDGGEWMCCEVVAHRNNAAVVLSDCHEASFVTKQELRPIRTPEQIAAEKRESEVNKMVATVSMLDKGWARKVCYSLYDVGYRKQEPKPE